MPTSYPGGLDNFTNPTASDTLDSATVPHAAQHANLNDAVEAVQSFLGTTGSPNVARLGVSNTFTVGGQFISNAVAADVPLTVRGAASQSNALTVWNDSANVQVARVDQGGSIRGGSFGSVDSGKALLTPNGVTNGFLLSTNGAANLGIVVRGASGQTANLQEWHTSTGDIIAEVSPSVFRVGKNNLYPARFLVGASDLTSAISVTTHSASQIGLGIRGAASQTSNLQEWQNSAGTILGRVTSGGSLQFSNISGLNARGWLYASPDTGTAFKIGDLASTTVVGLQIQAGASHTGNLLEFRDSSNGLMARIANNGNITTTQKIIAGAGSPFTASQFGVIAGSASTVGAIIMGAASQTANLQEWQNDSGTVLARIGAGGFLQTITDAQVGGNLGVGGLSSGSVGQLAVYAGTATRVGAVIRGAVSQTANLLELQNSTGAIVARFDSGGTPVFGTTLSGYVRVGDWGTNPGANLNAVADIAGRIPIVARGAAAQTAHLLQAQDSAGTVVFYVTASGGMGLNGRVSFGTDASARFNVSTQSTSQVGQVIRGFAGQTSNLQEWQDSTGTNLARIDNGGNFKSPNIATTNSRFQAFESNNGAGLMLLRMTVAQGNPGANFGVLYFRDGTNAGTLKLVVRAGAAGAETTILDNIPQ